MTTKREITASPLLGWRLLESRCRWALSRFCASWLLSPALRLCARPFCASWQNRRLHWRWSFVSRASLARLCSRRFWSRSWRLSSWDSAVSSFTPFIAIRFVLKKLQVQTKLYSRKVPKGFDVRKTLLRNAHAWWWWSAYHNQASKIEMASRI